MKWARTRWEATPPELDLEAKRVPIEPQAPRRCRRRRSRCDPGPGRGADRTLWTARGHGETCLRRPSAIQLPVADAIEHRRQARRIEHRLFYVSHESSRTAAPGTGTRPAPAAGAAGWRRRNGPETRDRIEQRIDALPRRGLGLHDRRTPLPLLEAVQPQHRLDRATIRSAPSRSALLTTKTSGNLHDPGLERLDLVARPRHQRDDGNVGRPDDVDLVLADADRLDQDDVLAAGIEDQRHVAGRSRQAAEVAARRHAADEDARVAGVRLHADAIAENGAAAERAGRIDRDDADRLPAVRIAAISRSTSVLLPAPGGPVMPMRWARPVCGVELTNEVCAGGRLVLNERNRAGERRGSPA